MFLSVCLEEFGGGIGKLKYRPNQSLPLLFILVTLAGALPMGFASAGSGDRVAEKRPLGTLGKKDVLSLRNEF